MKLKMLLMVIFANSMAIAAPNQWTNYSCSQMCGLTENSYSSVYFSSIDYSETLTALRVLCESQQMKLQKQPNCVQTQYDKTTNEAFQRCRAGLASATGCAVSVVGYEAGSTTSTSFNSDPMSSFDKAQDQAMSKCQAALKGYTARCIIYQYYLSQY